MIEKEFKTIWNQLNAKKPQFFDYLNSISLKKIRGINNLTVPFTFPVSVLAGPNSCGKSTVLYACLCAYKITKERALWDSPVNIFPDLIVDSDSVLSDQHQPTEFEYSYLFKGNQKRMSWKFRKGWSKSYFGERNAVQPTRDVYLRTLTNLSNPAEFRSNLNIGRKGNTSSEITSDLIAFAQRILPYEYSYLKIVSKSDKELLIAQRKDINDHYSEFHMSAGERAMLRLSKDISTMQNALILIDEIEAGLHPYTQQKLMLELQRLALRNDLQIIITTHSPIVLDCVPPEGRIFLERQGDNVIRKPAYRDIIQNALYGKTINKLNILCEDEIAESIIGGMLPRLTQKLNLIPSDIIVGRDTGKYQFNQHIEALGKFNLLDTFIFVLDGDARDMENKLKNIGNAFHSEIQPLFLPGQIPPEQWVWDILKQNHREYADTFGIDENILINTITEIDQLYLSATDKPSDIIKNKLNNFGEKIKRDTLYIAQNVSRKESDKETKDTKDFLLGLEQEIVKWRNKIQ